MTSAPPHGAPLAALPADPLNGRFAVPADPVLARRALLVAALAVGRSTLEGVPASLDATVAALRRLGVGVATDGTATRIDGLGPLGLLEPDGPLVADGVETATLLGGLVAPYRFATRIAGHAPDAGLAATGAAIEADGEASVLRGPLLPVPFAVTVPAGAEPLKSALLLTALQTAGISTVTETTVSADHTEKLLAAFGAGIAGEPGTIRVTGLVELKPRHLVLPGDPALAGLAVVAALAVPGSEVTIENVLVNPLRTGLIDTLLEMGGDIQFVGQREVAGEPVADLRVRSSRLKGVRVAADHAAAMLADIPALAIAAACAHGETTIEGLGALRDGTDRLAAIAAGLAANRITVAEGDDSLSVTGNGRPDGGGHVVSRGDAGVALAFLVLGLAAKRKVTVDDATVETLFPDFAARMGALGARFEPGQGGGA